MAIGSANPWPPTRFRRFVRFVGSSTSPVEIVTDAGHVFAKVLGNPEGSHALACEFVGTQLARWIGLATFDFAIMNIARDDEIPLRNGRRALPGPAFVTKKIRGHAWGGTSRELEKTENVADLVSLIILDTWLQNPDRHPRRPQRTGAGAGRRPNRDNVFLTSEKAAKGHVRLIAMDFTHCITVGRDLSPKIAHIDEIQDDGVYGLFDEFTPYLKRAHERRQRENSYCFWFRIV
ncbi:MAG: hypothetical protein HY286_12420 [Planctomycetes bacterium]|nr:hypothetical protein [Planctomycetota bacterium]